MQVTLKTLQEDVFTVEIDPTQSVKKFKEKIEKVKGDDFPAKNMKLMYAGKILADNKKVCDYNVQEKKFVIVFVKKPKEPVVVRQEPESSTDEPMDRNAEENGQRAGAEPPPEGVCCAEHDSLVRHIVELGFTRDEVEAALRSSYDNPDRAVEYLINGVIPCSSSTDDSDTEARQRDVDISDSSDAHLLRQLSTPGPVSPSSNMPDQERIMQLFAEAMDDCENQTRAADSMLENDHDLITQNAQMEADEVIRRYSVPSTSSDRPAESVPDSSLFSSDRMFQSLTNAFRNTQSMSFTGNLVDRDHEAIERLKQLGFSDHKAIEAYFVCERNENAAADYLFSQNFD